VGLAIVRRIANLHGWSVQAEGETGKGAMFRVVAAEPGPAPA
jgi:signal transduction histidine kinase